MSYHHCPIEPDDWANGPSDPDGVECHTCQGTGEIIGDDDMERTCPTCDGCGFIEPEIPESDY